MWNLIVDGLLFSGVLGCAIQLFGQTKRDVSRVSASREARKAEHTNAG